MTNRRKNDVEQHLIGSPFGLVDLADKSQFPYKIPLIIIEGNDWFIGRRNFYTEILKVQCISRMKPTITARLCSVVTLAEIIAISE